MADVREVVRPEAPVEALVPVASQETAELAISGMMCASCARRVERALGKVPSVVTASVNLATERATVSFNPATATAADLIGAVERAGYGAEAIARMRVEAPVETGEITAAEDAVAARRQAEVIRI